MTDRPVSLSPPPDGYADWLADLKTRIHSAQQRDALAVNRELVLLYWQMGQDILERQGREGWGAKVIERLAQDLRSAFLKTEAASPSLTPPTLTEPTLGKKTMPARSMTAERSCSDEPPHTRINNSSPAPRT
jgi:hypothetical protein